MVRLHFLKAAGNISEQEAIQTCWTLPCPGCWPPERWCPPGQHLAPRSSAALAPGCTSRVGSLLLAGLYFPSVPSSNIILTCSRFTHTLCNVGVLVPGVCSAQFSSCTYICRMHPQPWQRLTLWATFAESELLCESHGLWGWPLDIQPPSAAGRRYIQSTESCLENNSANALCATALLH